MKHNNHIKLLVAILLSIPLTLFAANNQISYLAQYMDNVTIGTDTLGGVTYSVVNYGDLHNGYIPGYPSLPIEFIRFSVPYNATNFTVTASSSRWANISLDQLIYPCQAPRMLSDTSAVTINLPDSAIYYSSASYPDNYAWVVDEGYLAGENHIVTVAVMPFSYTPSSNLVKKARNMSIKLKYDLSDTLASYPIVRNNSILRQEGFELTKRMVVNPSNVITYAGPSPTNIDTAGLVINPIIPGNGVNPNGFDGEIPPIINPGIDSTYVNPYPGLNLIQDYCPYLIVTTQEYLHSLRRLVALKRQKGYHVKVVTMDEVMNDSIAGLGDCIKQPDGTYYAAFQDSVGCLRQFLRNYYINYGTQYALFVGNGVPYKSRTMRMETLTNREYPVPTDSYLIELNDDWSKDTIGFQPEIFAGRILAKSSRQIDNYTDKLMRYELNPGHGDYDYLGRAFYGQSYDLIEGGELGIVRFQMDKIFTTSNVLSESRGNINEIPRSPSGEEIINMINTNKYGFVSLHHHGVPAGLITYGIRNRWCVDSLRFLWSLDTVHIYQDHPRRANDDPSISNGLNNLTNKLFPCIGYSTACNAMPFGTQEGYESLPMNFGESFTTGKDYGGPAFLGNTCFGYTPSTGYHEAQFGLNINNGYYKIGMANALAKPLYYVLETAITHDYTSVCQNLLGDPEFELWTDTPSTFTSINIVRNDSSVVITGIDANPTTVAFCYNNGIAGTFVASTSTITLNGLSPNSTIMIYKHNYIPYIAPLLLQNTNLKKNQYIIASDVTAGKSVDTGRATGDVTVKSGVSYEIEASGSVRLEDGFKVEKGATFIVNPSCF